MSDLIPLPPPDANVATTACDYCIVACGYKVYTWPVGRDGGPAADQNALGEAFPVSHKTGKWISPNQVSRCLVGGRPHNVVVMPDRDAKVVNRGGNHSIRGGCIAQKVYNPDGPTRDRLQTPLMRVGGKLTPVSWDLALDVMANVSKHVLDKYGETAWGMKTFSYEFFENTYAISKLAFEAIKTPAYSEHDKPGPGNDTAGVDDSGINTFSACYEDYALADVLFISGTDPFETKTIVFDEWMMNGGAKLIYALPRRTTGVAWAEANGGLFLQVIPGTDTILHLAIARLILENGWEDKEFIAAHVANSWEINSGFGRGTRNTPWQWRTTWGMLGSDYDGYQKWLTSYKPAALDEAAKTTGVSAEKIREAARMLTQPKRGKRPKASFAFEKGNYWSNNYLNTGSFAALGLICGAGSRPGQVISRLGGHQRGWASNAAGYPRTLSPEKVVGRRRKEIDLDRWVEAGKLRFAYVIGTTWCQAMCASQELAGTFRKLTAGNPNQIPSASREAAVEALKKRVDSGGMVVVHQDIYLVEPMASDFADLVLPASGWGEHDFTRCNGERRLRLYSKFCDPPGEAKPDWWIISRFAKKMGFEGFDWEESNDVFEEGARFSRGGVLNYHPLVWVAKKLGRKGHDLLREQGTHGIQTPIRYVSEFELTAQNREYYEYAGSVRTEKGWLLGTKRLHDEDLQLGPPEGPTVHAKWLTAFGSHSGKALLHKTPWELFSDFFERIRPKGEELWVTNGRINEIWQSAFDDKRRPYIMERWPDQWVEIHPDDAKARGIESGDFVEIANDDVVIQTGGFIGVEGDDLSYTALEKAGHIRVGKGSCKGVAIVTPHVRPGVLFTNFLHAGSPSNSLAPRVPDPITNRYRFKLGKGIVRKTGESPYKHDLQRMTFAPRAIV